MRRQGTRRIGSNPTDAAAPNNRNPAAAMARHAADGASALGEPEEGYPLTPPVVQAMSRLYARETALHIATAGLRWMVGASPGASDLAELKAALNLAAIYRAQQGLLLDADLVARAL